MTNRFYKIALSIALFIYVSGFIVSSTAIAQNGFFKGDSLVLNRKSCDRTKVQTRKLVVELDDSFEDVDFVLRRIESNGESKTCPLRPSQGKTILNSAKTPDSFQRGNFDLTMSVRDDLFLESTAACSTRGEQGGGLLCLYAKGNIGSEAMLVAETVYRIYTRAQQPQSYVEAKTPDELAFIKAVENGNLPVARELLARGTNVEVDNALCRASRRGSVAMVQLLVDYGASLESVWSFNNGSYYPLDCAATWGQLEVMKLLLDLGANPDGWGGRVLSNTANWDHDFRAWKLLIDYGASTEKEALRHVACNLYHASKANLLISRLVDLGADFNLGCDDDDGNPTNPCISNPLAGGKIDIVKALLGQGANPNGKYKPSNAQYIAKYGTTGIPLLCSALNYDDCVLALLEAGGDPNATCEYYGRNLPLLYHAISGYRPSQVKMLLKHGANIDTRSITNIGDNTPLEYATWFLAARRHHNDEPQRLMTEIVALLQNAENGHRREL